jgi:glycosyltransferase involved in cell wall biosynthesis
MFSIVCFGQTQPVIVPKYIRLPADSVQSARLINSLDGFLAQASGPDKDNAFIQAGYLPETSALLDEIRGMGNAGAGKEFFYKCYLSNVDPLDSADYFVQFTYLAIVRDTPVVRASFKLIAFQQGDQYSFRSPLRRNTAAWHTKRAGHFIFHYTIPPDEPALNAYLKKAEEFDKKLHAPDYTTQFYCCNTFQEALELLGVMYKLDYNGVAADDLTAFADNTFLDIVGRSNTDPAVFDLHDLWHDRLHQVIPVSAINKPIDEGCAYLYAGSWGFSWEEIFKQFKAYMGDNKDWLAAFNENKNFGSSQQYHLYVAYVIDALLVQKIEKEKGFDAVMEFLACGKSQPGNDNYFAALDRIAGINRMNFNENVEKLVEEEK